MTRPVYRLLLLFALGLATWGLAVTVPRLLGSEPGFVAQPLYPVLVWAAIWVACVVGLVRSIGQRN